MRYENLSDPQNDDGRERRALENAEYSIRRNKESDSIETDENNIQPRNQEELRISIVCAMTRDAGEELKKESRSIRQNNESDSMEINESDLQSWKQPRLRILTVRGMTMGAREELENAED
jgi:hypothetical protein